MEKTHQNVWMRALAALALAMSLLRGQTNTAALDGRVLDSSGAAVIEASVTVVQTKTAYTRETKSDDAGNFQFPLLPPGTYEITAEHPGFKTERRQGIILAAGDRGRIDLTLSVG